MFSRVVVIPEKWKEFVEPGLDFVRTDMTLFDPVDATPNRRRLVNVLFDDNPFLSAAALKALLLAGEVDRQLAARALARNLDWRRQAVVAYSIMKFGGEGADQLILPEAAKLIESADALGEVRGLTFAAFAACDAGEQQLDEERLSYMRTKLMQTVARKNWGPTLAAEEDDYLDDLLRLTGVQKEGEP